jgi:hypothetical protein
MNETVIIIAGCLCVALAVGLIVGGARTKVGAASTRIYAIVGGLLLMAVALVMMTFGLPKVQSPYLLPSSIGTALIVGWVGGMMFGANSERFSR